MLVPPPPPAGAVCPSVPVESIPVPMVPERSWVLRLGYPVGPHGTWNGGSKRRVPWYLERWKQPWYGRSTWKTTEVQNKPGTITPGTLSTGHATSHPPKKHEIFVVFRRGRWKVYLAYLSQGSQTLGSCAPRYHKSHHRCSGNPWYLCGHPPPGPSLSAHDREPSGPWVP